MGVAAKALTLQTLTVAEALAMLGLLLTGIALLMSPRLYQRDWFHPLVFPFAYVSLALLLPPLGDTEALRQVGTSVALATLSVFGLTVLGLAAGAQIGIMSSKPSRRLDRDLDYGRLRNLGRLAVVLAIGCRIYLASRLTGPYGAGSVSQQLSYGLTAAVDNLGDALLFTGVVLSSIANVRLRRRAWSTTDLLFLAVFAIVALGSGHRAVLIAPGIFLLWAQHTLVKPIRFGALLLLALVTLFVFQGVQGARRADNTPFFANTQDATDRTLNDLDSVFFITSEVVAKVPGAFPYANGSTYLAALKRQLPGPIATSLFGPPTDTATYQFRRLIGLTNPNYGVGFALPAEGYLNFGYVGAVAAGLFGGLLLGWSYRKGRVPPTRVLHLLYPICIAFIPYAIRTDALAQLKQVLYPCLLAWLAFSVSDRRRRRKGSNTALDSVPVRHAPIESGATGTK